MNVEPLDTFDSAIHHRNNDDVTKQVSATQIKSRFLALLEDVEAGEDIEITKNGLVVALLIPASRPRAISAS